MYKSSLLWLALASFWLSPLNELFSQECISLLPKQPQVMGLPQRVDVNLDDVDPVTLPVVFHVVHTGEDDETNISDEQVLSQIDALDSGFRWGPGVDTKIQFCIASRDPDGNPTNGITRHNGSSLFGSTYTNSGVAASSIEDGVNDIEFKQTVGCWNPDEYINFYIVSEINGNNGGGGVQGYAYVGGYSNGPGGGCGDGIVQLYNVTGTTGVLKPGRTLGKTGVHEMGHQLDLYHTFGFIGSCDESNCETQGDQVCDTPPTELNNGCSSVCEGAMVENFMDYTSETCKYTFTQGQAERMWDHLLSNKQELIDSYSCVPPVDYDLAITSVSYQESWCTDYQDIVVTITNQGTNLIGISDVTLSCNGIDYTQTVFTLSQGAGVDVVFENVLVSGASSFEVSVMNDLDEYSFNDTSVLAIEFLDGDLLQIDVYKDFWGNISWQLLDPDGAILIEDFYPAGIATYNYSTCIYEGCYTVAAQDPAGDGFCTIDLGDDGICNIGEEGIVGTIGQDTVFATGWGLQFSEWEQTYCNTFPQCNMDYDGNGYVGTPDVLTLLADIGCEQACYTDPNDDGIVNVQDLLFMLASVGPCPEE